MDKQQIFILCVMAESLNLDREEDRNVTSNLLCYAAMLPKSDIPDIGDEEPSISEVATDFINLNR